MADERAPTQEPQTTGHVWDDDLREFNNPLPEWWIYGFYATIVFAVVYWVIYPSWPLGQYFMTGVGSISYQNAEGEEETWHWNTRAKLLKETQEAAIRQKPYLDRIASLPYEQIAKDAELVSFVQSAGRILFLDNCAPCHQSGGQGKVGYYPNLTDDDWKFGGTFEKVHQSIAHGRHGYMPPLGESLPPDQLDALVHYVLSISGNEADAAKAALGDQLFHSHTAACYYCHGKGAKGRQDMGSANLTDQVWQWADVPGIPDQAGKVAAVKKIVVEGLSKGYMPAWEGRLKPEQIKVLTVYVHELGGGK